MPTYVYRCQFCGYTMELVQKITDEFRPVCPNPKCTCDVCDQCQSIKMERVLQPSAFVLKGSCWAKDGYSGGGK